MRLSRQAIDILLVEDNPGDARLVQKAFELGQLVNRFFHVSDGQEALDFLRRRGQHQDSQRPDIILLDLNMPGIDGRQVLAEIKVDPELLTIPVIVMTTSAAEQDIETCYKLHANCYIMKPLQVQEFLDLVKRIEEFWIGIVCLPGRIKS